MQVLQVVEENKRQLCVFSLLSDQGDSWKWWDYAASFAAECTMANGRFADRSCIRAQLEKVGLTESNVDTCMGDSTVNASHDLLQVRNLHARAMRHIMCFASKSTISNRCCTDRSCIRADLDNVHVTESAMIACMGNCTADSHPMTLPRYRGSGESRLVRQP